MREDTPTKKALRLKDSLRKRKSRAREDSPTRLARQSQVAAHTHERRVREDSPTRLARRSQDSERKKVKRSDPEQNIKEAAARREAYEKYRVLVRGETHGME